MDQRVEYLRRAEVHIEFLSLPQLQQALFRTQLGSLRVPLRATDRSKQDGMRIVADRNRFGRKGHGCRVNRRSTDQPRLKPEHRSQDFLNGLQDLDTFSGDFPPDSVSRQYGDSECSLHTFTYV